MSPKRLKILAGCVAGCIAVLSGWYSAEPWVLTFMDDGPYRSAPFDGEIADLALHSAVELRRLGRVRYVLRSHLAEGGDSSVFVLSDPAGKVIWQRVPTKPDGELGPVALVRSGGTWYAGWWVAIKPARQESGYLYLGPLGGFRFFNHSW